MRIHSYPIISKNERFTVHKLAHYLLKPLISVWVLGAHVCQWGGDDDALIVILSQSRSQSRRGAKVNNTPEISQVSADWLARVCAALRIRHIELLTLLWQAWGRGQLVLHYIKFKRNNKIVKSYILSQSIFIQSKAQYFTGTVYHKI